jgi:uncharacterized protein (TIGR02453 family)
MARGRISGANGVAAGKTAKPAAAVTPPRRQSQRLGSSATKSSTPKKSVYFEHGSDEEDLGDDASSTAYEEDEGKESATSPEVSEEEYDSSDDASSRKRKRAVPKRSSPIARKVAKGNELWREGVKSELAPGEEVFIALPKAREPGKTPYRDETIHPNTMLFLGDLKRNNERSWLKLHDKDFRQSEKDWKSFVDQMTEKLTEVDDTLPELPAKDIVFRIYRDVRFSNDPTPYKPHFSGCWSRTGRKGPYAAYYLQISPGRSFIGGGLWCPEAQYLAVLRRDFDQRSNRIKSVLADPALRREFLGGAKDEKKALKEFLGHNSENALKRHPKGYDEENPNIGLLRLRSFTLGRKLSDSEVTDPKAIEKLTNIMGTLTPFVS